MLKQLRIEGGKENGDKNVGDNKEATLAKADDKVKENGKSSLRGKDNKNKKRETWTCNIVEWRGLLKLSVGFANAWEILRQENQKKGSAVEEENHLSIPDICDDVISMQVDIEVAYVLAPIVSIDSGFGNVTDCEDILDLKTPTECDDKEVSKWKASCLSKASLHRKGHKDHNNDVEPPMSIYGVDDVEVDYEFHNNGAFAHIALGLQEEDVEEVQGLSQFEPTLQALNSPNMWICDMGVTKHSTKHK